MEIMKDDNYGSYEFKKEYMNNEPEPKGRCTALVAIFVSIMISIMCWGFWIIWN
jgi:hypothetical protein